MDYISIPNEGSALPLDQVMQALGQRLEAYRISRNIRQSDLADMAGLSRMTVSKLESGKGGTLDSLLRVLRALGVEDRLQLIVPEAGISPLDPRSGKGQQRQRVRLAEPGPNSDEAAQWAWGEDAPEDEAAS
jgi:transcriptional regulator with XRE-family HTH domain